jgi:hypothetical protein
VLAGVWLASFGMKKKPSAPLLRLAYIHLLASRRIYRPLFERVTASFRPVNGIQRRSRKKSLSWCAEARRAMRYES